MKKRTLSSLGVVLLATSQLMVPMTTLAVSSAESSPIVVPENIAGKSVDSTDEAEQKIPLKTESGTEVAGITITAPAKMLVGNTYELKITYDIKEKGGAASTMLKGFKVNPDSVGDATLTPKAGGLAIQKNGTIGGFGNFATEADTPDTAEYTINVTPTREGNFSITGLLQYTYYTIENGEVPEGNADLTIEAYSDASSLDVVDYALYEGETFSPEMIFVKGTNVQGDALVASDVTYTQNPEKPVNTQVPGTYEVTATYGDISKTATVTVKENKAELVADGKDFYDMGLPLGASLADVEQAYKGAIKSVTDKDGNPGNINDVAVSVSNYAVNTMGQFKVTYTYYGKTYDYTPSVKDLSTIAFNQDKVSDGKVVLYVGDTFKPTDMSLFNTEETLFVDGSKANFDNNKLTATGTIDTTTPGTGTIEYGINKETINGADATTATLSVEVKEDKSALETKPTVNYYIGDTFDPKSVIETITDRDGNSVLDQEDAYTVTIKGDLTKEGAATATVKYTVGGKDLFDTTVIMVKADKSSLSAEKVNLYQGQKFDPKAANVKATDRDGNEIAFENITVTGQDKVNSNVPGTYKVTYKTEYKETTIDVTVEAAMKGDVTNDGKVNLRDVVALQNYLMTGDLPEGPNGVVTLEYLLVVADYNNNGKIDLNDIVSLQQQIMDSEDE